jgi:hypothetical protein
MPRIQLHLHRAQLLVAIDSQGFAACARLFELMCPIVLVGFVAYRVLVEGDYARCASVVCWAYRQD